MCAGGGRKKAVAKDRHPVLVASQASLEQTRTYQVHDTMVHFTSILQSTCSYCSIRYIILRSMYLQSGQAAKRDIGPMDPNRSDANRVSRVRRDFQQTSGNRMHRLRFSRNLRRGSGPHVGYRCFYTLLYSYISEASYIRLFV